MSLRDIDRSIYDPKSHIERDRKKENQFDPTRQSDVLGVSAAQEEIRRLSEEEKVQSKIRRRKFMIIGGIACVAFFILAFVAIGIIRYQRTAFSAENVTIQVEGPDKVTGGSEAVFIIRVKNDNRTELANADITLNFPQTFVPTENANFERRGAEVGNIGLGTLAPRSERSVEFRGRFKGAREENATIQAVLSYMPKNFSSPFQTPDQKTVKVDASSLLIDVIAPIEVADGDEAEYLVNYKNLGSDALYSVRMKLDLPAIFDMVSSEPAASEGENVWYIGGLESGDSGTIRIKGILSGNRNEEVTFRATMGVIQGDNSFLAYSETFTKTKIVKSPLHIEQTVNGTENLLVNAGDTLRFVLKYRNDGDVALRDVIIRQTLSGKIFNYAQAKLYTGSLNAEKQTIIWRASDVSGLAVVKPGQEGTITYEIPILANVPLESVNDKNFSSVSAVVIDSNDVPDRIGEKRIVGADRSEFKLNSDLVSRIEVVNVESGAIESVPRLVYDKENVFEVRWKISNLYNDVTNAVASLSIPSGIAWKGLSQTSENVIWNERTQKLTWELGKLDNGVGVLTPVREVVFTISTFPEKYQAGQEVNFMTGIEVTGEDQYTGEKLRDYKENVHGRAPL